MTNRKVGMKCVCIRNFEDRLDDIVYGVIVPKKDQILTIRTIHRTLVGVFLKFEEIKNPVLNYADEAGEARFTENHFAPLLSTFKKITYTQVLEKVAVCKN